MYLKNISSLIRKTGRHSVCIYSASFHDLDLTETERSRASKINNRDTRDRCEIGSKLTVKTPERRRSGLFIVNFEHVLHLFLVFLVLTLKR